MADVAVTNTTVVNFNADVALTKNAATEDAANTAQVFVITPTKQDGKVIIGIEVGPTNGAVAWSIAAGDFWQGVAAKTGSTAQATTDVIELESAKYKQSDGTFAITFTPATGKKLKTDHALNVWAIQAK